MDATSAAYERLIESFVGWAEMEQSIRGAIVIGSRARADHPADEWSDLDIVVFATDPGRYSSQADWVANVGNAWLTFVEATADGRGLERRVLFEGGLDADFALMPVELIRQAAEEEWPGDAADALRRGVRVLLDKDGVIGRALALLPEPAPAQPPTGEEFAEAVADFWYHAVWTAKHLRRGELWWARGSCDGHMKRLLQRMLEWHARATKGADCDTWLRGRFLEEWADKRAVAELRGAFAHYDETDVWRALGATTDLFRWLAGETAQRLGYPYPSFGDERAPECVRRLRADAR